MGHNADNIESMKPNRSRILRIRFNADTSSNLTWKFRPQQTELKVALGETALAFYTATNPTDRPIDGNFLKINIINPMFVQDFQHQLNISPC